MSDFTEADYDRFRAAEVRSERQLAHSDLVDILNALGLGLHARPLSPHEVVQLEVLPAIGRLRSGGDKDEH